MYLIGTAVASHFSILIMSSPALPSCTFGKVMFTEGPPCNNGAWLKGNASKHAMSDIRLHSFFLKNTFDRVNGSIYGRSHLWLYCHGLNLIFVSKIFLPQATNCIFTTIRMSLKKVFSLNARSSAQRRAWQTMLLGLACSRRHVGHAALHACL